MVKNNFYSVLTIAASAIAVGSIQLLYWKKISGKFFFFSYPGEWFDFTQPHLSKALFSYQKGLLLYSPLLLIAFYGLYLLYRRKHVFFYPVAVFTVLNIYVIASWSNWWYGGGYGHRAFIAAYAVFVIPLAFAIEHIFQKKNWKRVTFTVVCFLMLALNLFQTWQFDQNINCRHTTTRQSYWNAFFAVRGEDVDFSLRSKEYTNEEVNALSPDNFTSRTLALVDCVEKTDSTPQPGLVTKDVPFSKGYKEGVFYITDKPHSFLKVTALVKTDNPEDINHIATTISFQNKKETVHYLYFSEPLSKGIIKGDSLKEISFRCAMPTKRFNDDWFKVYLYNFDGFPTRLEVYWLKVEMCDIQM